MRCNLRRLSICLCPILGIMKSLKNVENCGKFLGERCQSVLAALIRHQMQPALCKGVLAHLTTVVRVLLVAHVAS